MKHFHLLLLVLISATACSTARRVPAETVPSWMGRSTLEILDAMGDPVRIDTDGRDGSILVYESAPDYDDPKYDILNPEVQVRTRKYAKFYLNSEGVCYQVDANRDLPVPPRNMILSDGGDPWFNTVLTISLLFLIFL